MPALPSHTTRDLVFDHGAAIGISNKWAQGQYCSILTASTI
jgi:hypothetical protein